MNKVITISIFGIGSLHGGVVHNNLITVAASIDTVDFAQIRERLKADFGYLLSREDVPELIKEAYRYKFTIAVVTERGSRFKMFEINPYNLKKA